MHRSRRKLKLVALAPLLAIGAAAGLLACSRMPAVPTFSSLERLNALIGRLGTIEELSDYVGGTEPRCLPASPEVQLCEWEVPRRSTGWAHLARSLRSLDDLRLVCELPLDGRPRQPNSCLVYPQRTDASWWTTKGRAVSMPGNEFAILEPGEASLARVARERIEAARTLPALTHVMGAIPTRCAPAPPARIACDWNAGERMLGQGTLAVAAGEPDAEAHRLRCRLPSDGSARGADSCEIEFQD